MLLSTKVKTTLVTNSKCTRCCRHVSRTSLALTTNETPSTRPPHALQNSGNG